MENVLVDRDLQRFGETFNQKHHSPRAGNSFFIGRLKKEKALSRSIAGREGSLQIQAIRAKLLLKLFSRVWVVGEDLVLFQHA